MKVFAYSYRHFDEEPFFEKYCKELGIELGYTEKDPTLETAELARGYEYISILLTRVDAQLVEKFASMGVKVISNRLIGTDHVDVKRAKELGMEDTHFVNCTGLPAPGHLTSAYDIALMSRQLLLHHGHLGQIALVVALAQIFMQRVQNGLFVFGHPTLQFFQLLPAKFVRLRGL